MLVTIKIEISIIKTKPVIEIKIFRINFFIALPHLLIVRN